MTPVSTLAPRTATAPAIGPSGPAGPSTGRSTSGGSAPARSSTPTRPAPLEWAHECDPDSPETGVVASQSPRSPRFIGLDAARGLALIGMFAVHTISAETADGNLSLAWALSSGKASALFAILGGVGMAFMTGRTRPPCSLPSWGRVALTPLVRGILILAIGLALGALVSIDDADVILPYLGLMFALSALLVPFGSVPLLTIGFGWAIVAPILSYLLRTPLETTPRSNLTIEQLLANPGGTLASLMLTGFFPALTWMAYICIGMGIGRADLSSRRVVAWLIAGGAALTTLTAMVTQVFITMGIRDQIAAQVRGHMTLEQFTEYLVWGGDGSLPTDSVWWLGINAPHTGTPLDLLYTSGIALTVIGLMLALSVAIGPLLHILAAPGSMTLTLYSAHLLLLAPLRELPDLAHFGIQVAVLTLFALAWSSRFSRGPMEWLVWRVTRLVTPARTSSSRASSSPTLAPQATGRAKARGRHRAPRSAVR